ncbi:MAG: PEP-CTERM sorting domain-containing protein [Leptolyngbyaceae cyanobacterium]
MKLTRVFLGMLVTGSTLLGAAGQADAASALRSYQADEYKDGQHAVWLHGLKNAGYAASSDFLFDTPGMLTEWDADDDGDVDYIQLMGTVSNKGNSNQIFDLDLKFDIIDGWTGGTKGASHAGGRQNALTNWDFYSIDTDNSTLIGQGEYAGSELQLFNRASSENTYQKHLDNNGGDPNPTYVGQLGEGANDKDKDLGFSVWFGYTGELYVNGTLVETYTVDDHKNLTKSDINLDLEPKSVPEPASAAGLMVLAGVATVARRRQKGSQAEA